MVKKENGIRLLRTKEKSEEERTATRKNSAWKYTLKHIQSSLIFDVTYTLHHQENPEYLLFNNYKPLGCSY